MFLVEGIEGRKMHRRNFVRKALCAAALASVGLSSHWAGATTFTWNTTSGTFSTAGNWTPGGPPAGTLDTALVAVAGTHIITFTNSPSIGTLTNELGSTSLISSGG